MPTKVAVLYASDYTHYSPGGIREFIRRIGRYAPAEMSIDYIGVGRCPAGLPRPQDRFLSYVEDPSSRTPLNLQFLQAVRHRRNELDKYDALVAQRPEYLLVSPPKVPTALVLHGGTWNAWKEGRHAFGFAYSLVEAVACSKADTILTVDKAGLNVVNARLARRSVGIRVPADDVFINVPASRLSRWPLITACRLVPQKRVDRLIRLAALVDQPLIVYGDGRLRKDLERLAHNLNAPVDFRGESSAASLASCYAEGGTFCSSSAAEGYPLAAVEALAAGLPLVGVQTKGLRQLTEYGARSFPTIQQAATYLRDFEPTSPDRARVWADHSPRAVGTNFWRHVQESASSQ